MWILQESKFLKSKDTVDLCRVNFDINISFIQYNRCSCCKHITSGFNTICMGLSVYKTIYMLCIFVLVWYQMGVLVKNHITCQTSLNLTHHKSSVDGKKKKNRRVRIGNVQGFFHSHLLFYEKPLSYLCLFSNSLNLQHRRLEHSVNYDLGLSGEILSVTASMIDL